MVIAKDISTMGFAIVYLLRDFETVLHCGLHSSSELECENRFFCRFIAHSGMSGDRFRFA